MIGGALRNVLNAQKLIEWLIDEKDIVSRDEGVALGRQFVALGVLRHGQQHPLSFSLCSCCCLGVRLLLHSLQLLMAKISETPAASTGSQQTMFWTPAIAEALKLAASLWPNRASAVSL